VDAELGRKLPGDVDDPLFPPSARAQVDDAKPGHPPANRWKATPNSFLSQWRASPAKGILMLGNRTFNVLLLVWLMTLGTTSAILKSNPPPSSSRPEPIEIEPPPLAAAQGVVSLS